MREFDMNQNEDLYYEEYDEGISLERVVDYSYCSSKNKIDLVDEYAASSYERQMGRKLYMNLMQKIITAKTVVNNFVFRINKWVSDGGF